MQKQIIPICVAWQFFIDARQFIIEPRNMMKIGWVT